VDLKPFASDWDGRLLIESPVLDLGPEERRLGAGALVQVRQRAEVMQPEPAAKLVLQLGRPCGDVRRADAGELALSAKCSTARRD